MSSWLNGLTKEEQDEIYTDNCNAYNQGIVNEAEFRNCLVRLGYNAKDIEDLEKFYRPPPPENEGD